ncbi:MAG: SDR family NAD(P)-dependent oxidoreductase [Chloroflexi bacterium]|nr:SDR family NAD(P)-dependent oxidoreductase [Chloroflexota bacterium]
MGKLDGKVAIVTGASRGLGKDVALALAREGAIVVAAARTEADGQSRIPGTLDHTVGMITEAGGKALAVRCDVANEDDISRTVQTTLDAFGKIDILVNNAGIQAPGNIMQMEARHWNLLFRVNVNGPFLFSRVVIPHMARNGGGHIINVSSPGAIGPGAGPYGPDTRGRGATSYGATKKAVERFTQGLAAEIWQDKVSVNVLSPEIPIWTEGGHFVRSRAGDPKYAGWRMEGDIFGDAAVEICAQEPGVYTGNIVWDHDVMMTLGGMSPDDVQRRYPVEG